MVPVLPPYLPLANGMLWTNLSGFKPQLPHPNTKVACLLLIVVVRIRISGYKCLAYWLTGHRHTLILFFILSAIEAT